MKITLDIVKKIHAEGKGLTFFELLTGVAFVFKNQPEKLLLKASANSYFVINDAKKPIKQADLFSEVSLVTVNHTCI